MNAEDGMMVENSHFHENWNVKLSLRFRVSANQQNLISSDQKKKKKKKVLSYPLQVAKVLHAH